MLFVVYCRDAENGAALRKIHLEAHGAHIGKIKDRIMLAGPIKDESGATFLGSPFVLETDSLQAARALIESDPFYKGGVYSEVRVDRFEGLGGKWVAEGKA